MEDKERQSICSLEPGQELNAFSAIGPFDLEPCGPMMVCSHRVEKVNFVDGKEQNVELYYCTVNWWIVCGGLFALLLVYLFIRRRMQSATVSAVSAYVPPRPY